MTIYEKPRSEVFASNAPESEISTFTAWLRGLGIAFDETNGLPEFSGLNNVFNLLNQYIKYLEQNGFAEWSPDLEYPIGAGVRVGVVWYRAKTQNISKPPATSQNDWELFLNASALTYENPIYIENNVVKVRGATQTQSGVVQFANATEVANKANVSKVITPSNVAQMFNRTSQQITLPDGTIIKFGSIFVNGDSNQAVVFSEPFLNNCINAQATLNSINFSAIDDASCGVVWGKTGLTLRNGCSGGQNISWLAIGY